MASGWAPDGAVQDQIDDSITDAVRLARAKLATGPGETHCQVYARRFRRPGARRCLVLVPALIANPASTVARNSAASIAAVARTAN